jgi:hypothetical protein
MLRLRTIAGAVAASLVLACALTAACSQAAGAPFGPFPPRNPYTAADGAATMHADSESSGASPYPGPGLGSQQVRINELGAACPTVLQGSDGMPIVLCTTILGRQPTVYLLDPSTGSPLASLKLPAGGNLFGGVYAYLDQHNQIVLFDADGNLLRIGHRPSGDGRWSLTVDSSISIAAALARRCPDLCGDVVGLSPDWRGRVWFATADGVAGYVSPTTGEVQTIVLGHGEQVANSISTSPAGTAVATDHALYLLSVNRKGVPRIVWRYAYDRGPARKPGQLSHGTGSTPIFFGGEDGTRYLAFTDNAVPAEHLIVIDTWARVHRVHGRLEHAIAARPQVACEVPVLTPGPSGTENAPVGSGGSVFVASTYGYPYPAYPSGAGASEPATAPFTGGVTRVNLDPSGHGCRVAWQDGVRSAAVPRLDVPDGILWTVQRTDPLSPDGTSDLDSYNLVAIDAATGAVLHSTLIGAGYLSDTLQLSPTIVSGGVLYQGTISGVVRIAP